MANTASELLLRITGDSSGGTDALQAFEHSLAKMGEMVKDVAENAFGPLGLAIAGVGVIMVELAAHARETAEHIEQVSLTTGIAADALSDLKFAVEATGGEFDTLNRAMFMFDQRMANSGKKVQEGLSQIGLSLDQIRTMSGDQQFLAISEALRSAGDETNRAAVAFDIFGRSGRELLPTLMKPLSDLDQKSRDLALTISQEDVKAAAEFTLSLNTLKATTSATWTQLGLHVSAADEVSYAYQRMKLAVANVALTVVDLAHAMDSVALANDLFVTGLPPVASALTGLKDGSGLAAKGLHDYQQSIVALQLSATELSKEELKRLDEELKKQGEEADKLNKAWANLRGRLEDLKPAVEEQVRHWLELGKSHHDIATALGITTEQVRLVDEEIKHEKKALDDTITAMARHREETIKATAAIALQFKPQLKELEVQLGFVALASKGFVGQIGLIPDYSIRAKEHFEKLAGSAKTFGETLETSVIKTLENLPKAMERAFAAGNWRKGIADLGAQLGDDLSTNINKHLQIGVDDKTGKQSFLGSLASGGIAAGISAGLGAGIKALFNIGKPSQEELDARKAYSDWQKGILADFDKTATAQQKLEAGGRDWAKVNIEVRDSYVAAGKTGDDAMRDLGIALDATHHSADDVKAALDRINDTMNAQKQDAADLDTAIKKYGFSIEELGPAMRKQQLTEQAVQLENAWRLLVQSGIDVGTVTQHMAADLNAYLQLSVKTGTEVPAEMQPIIQKMIDLGLLTDANGTKITDMKNSGITFSETMTQGFDRVVAALNKLISGLGLIPDAANKAAQAVDNIPGPPDYSQYMPPDMNYMPMAGGGMGRVTTPTLFLAGEAGPEEYAFSGAGKSFRNSFAAAGPGGSPIHTHVYLNGREIATAVTDDQDRNVRRRQYVSPG